MLKNIPKSLSPELLKVLCEMGHGDKIVIADANFPSKSIGKDSIVIRYDCCEIPKLLDEILQVFPLDTYSEKPISLMEIVKGDNTKATIWETYKKIICNYDDRDVNSIICNIDRFDFYKEAKNAYAIIATGEEALYANIILQKGVIK